MLESRVLGPLVLDRDGVPVPLGGRLARKLAVLLCLQSAAGASDDAVAECLWGEEPPARADASVQAYVSRLRAALGGERERLERTDGGYRLRVDDADAVMFEQAVATAVQALRTAPAEAAAAARSALSLWRGEPYVELGDASQAIAERVRLVELRSLAVEVWLEARLGLGEAAAVVAAAREAVDAEPFREHRWALLILALAVSGRQGEALSMVRQAKRMLADELGVDPGPELQDLERRLFSGQALTPVQPVRVTASLPRVRRPATAFHGRAVELERLDLAAGAPGSLTTVVGPGGVGKTRLALEWAARQGPTVDARVVRLVDVRHPDLLLPAVAEAAGLATRSARALADLAAALAGTDTVLLLDNGEHLTGALGPLAADLLDSVPDLRLVVTSREPLGVDGETVLTVPPLVCAEPDGADGPALALLLDRVARARGGVPLAAHELGDARRLCAAVEGLPLALELVAVRATSMSLGDIAARLDGRFDALGAVPVGSVAAHRDLAATIGWSVDLLDDADRAVLDRLWTFQGGFDLDLAVAVVPESAVGEVLQSVASLTAKSLMAVEVTEAGARYRMWETTRAFVREHAAAPGRARTAHAEAVRELVADAAAGLASPRSRHAVDRLTRDLPNVREMLRHDAEHAPAVALRAYASIDWFWFRTGRFAEGLHWSALLREAAPDAAPLDRARAWASTCVLAATTGDLGSAVAALAAAEGESRRLDGEHPYAGHLAYLRSVITAASGRPEEARRLAESAADIGRRRGAVPVEANGTMQLGVLHLAAGELQPARARLGDAARLASPHGTPWTVGMCALHLARGLLRLAPGDPELRPALSRAAAVFRQEGDLNNLALTLLAAADAADREGPAGQDRAGEAHALRSAVARASRELALPGDALTRGETAGPGAPVHLDAPDGGTRAGAVERLLAAVPSWVHELPATGTAFSAERSGAPW